MNRPLILVALICLPLALSGCILKDSRLGVSTPPALLYKHTKGPSVPTRGGFRLPSQYKTQRVAAHRVELGVPGLSQIDPAFQAADAISVGWGDISWEKVFSESGFEEAYFADYEEIEILGGLYTKSELIVYGN